MEGHFLFFLEDQVALVGLDAKGTGLYSHATVYALFGY